MDSLAFIQPSSVEEGEWTRDYREPQGPSAIDELFTIVNDRSFRKGTFTLSSGEVSNVYFNMKGTMMNARGAELAAREFIELANRLDLFWVSGLEMGAVPVIGSIAAVSSMLGRPVQTTFVRKTPKAHGTRDLIEGLAPNETFDGQKVLVIDDVSTTGKSILQAVRAVREAGGIVEHAACIVDRDEGGDELLDAHGVELHAILHVDRFLA